MGNESDIEVNIKGNETVSPAANASGSALKELKQDVKGSAEATAEHNIKTHEMRLLFTEINKILPGLGHDLHAAFAGPLGVVILTATAIAEVTEKLKEYNKALDEAAEKAADPTFLEAIEARNRIFNEAATSADNYAAKLNDILTVQTSLKKQMQDELEVDREVERARAELVSAEKGAAIAQIQQDEASGKMSPSQAAQARATVEKTFNDETQANREAAQSRELAEMQEKLAIAEQREASLRKAQSEAATAKATDEAHVAGLEASFGPKSKYEDNRKEYQQQANDALADLTKATEMFGPDSSDPNQHFIDEAKSTFNAAEARLTALRMGRTEYEAVNSPAGRKNTDTLNHTSEAAQKALDDNTSAIRDFKEKIEQFSKTITATRPIEEKATAEKDKEIDIQAQTGAMNRLRQEAETVTHYQKTKFPDHESLDKATQAIQDLREILDGVGPLADFVRSIGFDTIQLKQAMQLIQKDQLNYNQRSAAIYNGGITQ